MNSADDVSSYRTPAPFRRGIRWENVPWIAAALVMLLGAAEILFVVFDLGRVERFLSQSGPFPLAVGIGFLCAGGSLLGTQLARGRRRFWISVIFSLIVFVIGSIALAQHGWLWIEGDAPETVGGMTVGTAICFCAIAIALLMLSYCRRDEQSNSLLILPAGLAAFVALVSSLGYLTGLTAGGFWGGSRDMATPTAVGFLILGLGILFAGRNLGVLWWSLEWKPTVVFLSGIAVLTLASVIGWDAAAQLARTSRALVAAAEIQADVANLGSNMQDFSSLVRGYGLSDDAAYLDKIDATRKSVLELFDHLRTAGDATPGLQPWLDGIKPLIDERIRIFEQSMIVLKQSGSRRENAKLQALLREADDVAGEVLELTQQFIRGEQARIDALESEARSRSRRAFIVLPTAGLLSLIMVCLALASLNDEAGRRRRAEGGLLRANEDLERSNRELGQFAYVASHDLQEPLRMVSSYLQLLERRYSDKLDKDAHEFIAFAVDGAERMKSLIQALLALSRIGTRGGAFEKFSTGHLLDEVLVDLEQAVRDSGASITRDEMPDIIGDPTQLTLVFRNLISNALKFHASDAPVIHIGAGEHRDGWEFSVRDNGIGIDPRFAERIFGMFQRLHSREEFPGTGIGLAITKRVVERHGGRIWIENAAGGGTIFRFTIPWLKPTLES